MVSTQREGFPLKIVGDQPRVHQSLPGRSSGLAVLCGQFPDHDTDSNGRLLGNQLKSQEYGITPSSAGEKASIGYSCLLNSATMDSVVTLTEFSQLNLVRALNAGAQAGRRAV